MNRALFHIYLLALGEFNMDDYAYPLGEDGAEAYASWQYSLMIFYFIAATFLFLIHLLNMLIAIMGETFAKNNEIQDQVMIKSHLAFVIDNLWISAIKNKEQVKYVIACFSMDEDLDEEDLLINIEKQIARNQEQSSDDISHLQDDLLAIKVELESITIR